MGSNQRALSNQLAEVKTIVEATPEVLREIANRIEHASQSAIPGQAILVPLTGTILIQHTAQREILPIADALVREFDANLSSSSKFHKNSELSHDGDAPPQLERTQ